MVQLLIVFAALATIYLYYKLIASKSQDDNAFFRTLFCCVAMIFVCAMITDAYILVHMTADNPNWFSILVLSAFHSIELFFFQTHFFDNGYQEFFFGKESTLEIIAAHPCLACLMVVLFILACITSVALVIKVVNRRKAGRSWLSTHKDSAEISHVFFFGGEISYLLAEDIKKHISDNYLIFVGYPDPEDNIMDLSAWAKIQLLFKRHKESKNNSGPFDVMVYSRIHLSQARGTDICRQMGLRDLDFFLRNPHCKVYLLSDNEEENLRCIELLYQDGCRAEVFCRACREGVNRMYEDAMTRKSLDVHLIDSAYLAVRNIKNEKCSDLLPVRYVDIGKDENGLLEGWVSSEFNAMILGFGETGREMLGLLYEYGAFVDCNYEKSPFSCVVLDREMGNMELAYRRSFPGMNEEAGISFRQCEIGSNAFWNEVAARIQELNYVVVCMGNDRLNLSLAVDLLEYAYRIGKDLSRNFVILVAQENPTRLDEATLLHYKSITQYHDCIRTFGNNKDVWTYDNITNKSQVERAKRYYLGYMKASGGTGNLESCWDDREAEIQTTPDFVLHSKRVRQRSQDYANCSHASTKMSLVGPEILGRLLEIAQSIPADYTTSHYTGDDRHVEKVLHYLAVLEHTRWEASHVALGYTPGTCTDEIKKTHVHIKRYDELSNITQHYDYQVIKTTFELKAQGLL